jgi:hypothetical protein
MLSLIFIIIVIKIIKIKYLRELQYYESIGTADVVKNYWVDAINEDVASGRCGYVYEAGSTQFRFSPGNHIRLHPDTHTNLSRICRILLDLHLAAINKYFRT